MSANVRLIVREDDFESVEGLTQLIGQSTPFQGWSPVQFRDQALGTLPLYTDRAYVRAVYPIIERRLYSKSELEDDPELDRRYMDREMNDCDPEPHADMNRRQWFSNIQDGRTQNVESAYKPLLAALGTVIAIHRPKEAREWDRVFRQRIDAWADYDRARTETILRGHGRRPRPRR